jgi:hypothetical protein
MSAIEASNGSFCYSLEEPDMTHNLETIEFQVFGHFQVETYFYPFDNDQWFSSGDALLLHRKST